VLRGGRFDTSPVNSIGKRSRVLKRLLFSRLAEISNNVASLFEKTTLNSAGRMSLPHKPLHVYAEEKLYNPNCSASVRIARAVTLEGFGTALALSTAQHKRSPQ
jgi:hypothetical protein